MSSCGLLYYLCPLAACRFNDFTWFRTWRTFEADQRREYGLNCYPGMAVKERQVLNGYYERAVNKRDVFMIQSLNNNGDMFQPGDQGAPAHLSNVFKKFVNSQTRTSKSRHRCHYIRDLTVFHISSVRTPDSFGGSDVQLLTTICGWGF